MAILPIRTFGDPVLRERAREVEAFDQTLARLAEDMIETMHEAPGVGLAAPQVGRSIRLIVFDIGEGARALVNPVLSGLEGEQVGDEGCLSVPGLYFQVKRALKVRADALDVDGRPVVIEAEELMARVLQHEVDHINGVLFIDRLSSSDRKAALAAIRDQTLGFASAAPDPSRAL
ncbi:MAG TPA: peptide deformylase [Actinomycetota bacterium]|nr:peptide deformylase [Actinomycetota bacterium]